MGSFEERRKLRASWPIRKYRLGEEPVHDDRDQTTANERIALVWRLTLEAWAISGRLLPAYARHEMPGVLKRPPR